MAKKSPTKTKAGPNGGSGTGKSDMPTGEMDQPFNEGLMEMPSGGEMAAEGPSGMSQGGMTGSHHGMGGGLMPGESSDMSPAPQESDMPSGDMSST